MTVAVIPSTFQRLRRMDAAELRFRASTAFRNAVDRARATVARPAWDRNDLVLTGPGLDAVRDLLSIGDWMGAHRALARYFATREPRFPLSTARLDMVAERIGARFPNHDAARRADRIIAGRYDLLGYVDVDAGAPPNWHHDPVHDRHAPLLFWDAVPYLNPACGDHKVIWEINRQQHFLMLGRAFHLTGDRRYYREFVRQLASWIATNPPLQGINWASMLELAFRSLSWAWALHLFVGAVDDEDDYPWLVDMLLAMDRQLLHVEHNLSRYFSPNTHLSGEALALYVAGVALPELGAAERRAHVGRSVLVAEASRQVLEDGGHAERSAHYHRYSTEFYLLALNVARVTGDPAAAPFEETARSQAQYLRTIVPNSGELPLIGDDDGGQLFPMCGRRPADCTDALAHASVLLGEPSLALGPVPEETYWFCANHDIGEEPRDAAPWASRRFEASGYCVSRNDRGDHLVFDCGEHGYLNGGHAHADALSIVLTVANRPVLVDPGTATYTMDPAMRDRFRSTVMHNTVLVDRRPQSEPRGAFQWTSRTNATCTAWTSRAAMDYAEGQHDGYAGVTHIRRVLALHGLGWIIVDHLVGQGRAIEATAMWHIHPSWTVRRTGDRRCELSSGNVELAIVSTAPLADVNGPEAAYAPAYGRIETAPCLAATVTGAVPLTIATFVPASREWLPAEIRIGREPGIFEVLTGSGTVIVTSLPGRDPLVQITGNG